MSSVALQPPPFHRQYSSGRARHRQRIHATADHSPHRGLSACVVYGPPLYAETPTRRRVTTLHPSRPCPTSKRFPQLRQRTTSSLESVPSEHSGRRVGVEAGQLAEECEKELVEIPTGSGETQVEAKVAADLPGPGDGELQEVLSTRERLLGHVVAQEGAHEGCTMKIMALRAEWLDGTKEILTGAFSDAMGYLPAYKTLLSKQIDSYLQQHMKLPPLAIVLVAVLESESNDGACEVAPGIRDTLDPALTVDAPGESLAQDGGVSAAVVSSLVGTLELSFRPATRSRYLTLNPPKRCAYLCNMAIDSNFRRQGYGTKLLHAGELFAKMAGEEQIFLHVRLCDPEAQALYLNNGFEIVKTDNWFAPVLGVDRRHPMKKDLL
uniref:N-acetyltransferase domain-containing protein n=1 Tax=Tetraselmis chuii TaxID=63592 RepID=A0A7S1SUF7_9CHLO|mmetsp:Transcript_28515/g.50941  ORF Transcript_28515/g.50941 Transcript_28515/m.50941 type:complete len:380 (+) Transcript_28515:171-1310(+)